MAHGPRMSVAADYDDRPQAGVHTGRENPLGLSPSDPTHHPQSKLRLETSATDVLKQQQNLVMRVSLYRSPAYRAIMGTLTDVSSNDLCASIRIRMPVHLRPSLLVGEKFFLPFITGKYDNIETPGIIKGSATVVGLAQSLRDPESYDGLDAPGLAQTLERFFEMTALVTNLDETDEYGLPTQADRDFYRRLIGTWTAALRGYGAQSFETYDIVFVRDRCIQELMTAHRAIINTGQQQSPTTLKAALEAAWSTHTPLDFTKVMQDLLTWERNGRSDDKAAAAKRLQLRVASNATRATGKQGGGASNTGALSNTGTGSSGGGVSSSSGRTASTKSTSSTVQQGKSTSATRGVCISELLAVLQLGSPCRSATSTCKYTHVTDFPEAMQILKKTKGEMKDYLSNHNIVKQRMRSDPAWTNTFTMKLASL